MNDLTIQQPSRSSVLPEHSALTAELAKMLALVAPVTMSADQQTLWLASAVESLDGIRTSEVINVSLEVRRSVTRPSQIVPEIARLVAERRKRRLSIQEAAPRAANALPPPPKHIADRDRRNFAANDWAELNQYLERMGSSVRYGPDGARITA